MRTFIPADVRDAQIGFSVIVARYEGKWIYVQHRFRDTWEIPGGHREKGESPEETARRELWEETGASDFTLEPLFVYGVDREGQKSYGALYLAEVRSFGELPGAFEMKKRVCSAQPPGEWTYPEIQPKLQAWVEKYLLEKKARTAEETWDLFDKNRNLTGKKQERGKPIPEGCYHMVVNAWIFNEKGECLMSKRHPEKPFPLYWESSGGSALTGEDSLTAVLREVREELGIELDPTNGKVCRCEWREDSFRDDWCFYLKEAPKLRLQESEVVDARWMTEKEIEEIDRQGLLVRSLRCYPELFRFYKEADWK